MSGPVFLVLKACSHNVCVPLSEKCPHSEFFWSVFSRIRAEYGEILRISPGSVQMRENADQKNSEYRLLSRSVHCLRDVFFNKRVKKSYNRIPDAFGYDF